MLKRKADDQEGGSGKKGVPADDSKQQLIPRHLPDQSITLNFKLTTWDEFAPGKLYYLPTSYTPRLLFENVEIRRQLAKFIPVMESFEFHTPEVRISNLIFLQDDLRVQSSTPTDATAFTQVCYLIHYCPEQEFEYFKLGNLINRTNNQYEDLNFEFETNQDSSFLTVGDINYTDFEKLLVIPAQANFYAGWDSDQRDTFIIKPYNIKVPYISPTFTSPASAQIEAFHRYYSCNFNVQDDNTRRWRAPGTNIGFAKNQNGTKFYKYGDTISCPINTNMEGLRLAKANNNFFWNDYQTTLTVDGETIRYNTQFIYPGNNRPYLCRCTNYEVSSTCTHHNKNKKKLKHHFFTMPPIKKPNGALLGQRCSVVCEQTFSITINFSQANFFPNSDYYDSDMTDQVHKAIIRTGIYGDVIKGGKPPPSGVGGPLCPYGQDCSQLCDYDNTFPGLFAWLFDQTEATIKSVLTVQFTDPNIADEISSPELTRFTGKVLDTLYPTRSTRMAQYLEQYRIPLKDIWFKVSSANSIPVRYVDGADAYDTVVYLENSRGDVRRFKEWGKKVGTGGSTTLGDTWIKLNNNALDEAVALSDDIKCFRPSYVQHADYENPSKQINTFFM